MTVLYTLARKCTRLSLSDSSEMYLAALTGESTKVNSVGDVVADGTHVLSFMQLHVHWSHYAHAHTHAYRQITS